MTPFAALMLVGFAASPYLAQPPEVELPPAEQIAAERAFGMTVKGGVPYDDCDTKIEQVYFMPIDLNGDKVPEMIVRAYSGCWGNGGDMFAVLKKTPAGWAHIGEGNGTPGVLKAVHGGWHDIEIGQPGFNKMPVLVWKGKEYSQ